jgi:hypothetical protein
MTTATRSYGSTRLSRRTPAENPTAWSTRNEQEEEEEEEKDNAHLTLFCMYSVRTS